MSVSETAWRNKGVGVSFREWGVGNSNKKVQSQNSRSFVVAGCVSRIKCFQHSSKFTQEFDSWHVNSARDKMTPAWD